MYKMIIADDEEIIREGLAGILDWNSLGFQVVAKFEDGRDVIGYIKNYPVDVIISDIKMTFVSGIDVAKYIYENNLDTKIILLSGFKEFEFAIDAMRYKVVHYLLKPVPLKDLYKTFEELKIQIDRERETKTKLEENQKQMKEVISYSRQQFFINIVMGALGDEKEILKMSHLLGIKVDLFQCYCSLLHLDLLDFQKFIEINWHYGKEGLSNAIRNFFTLNDKEIQFYIIRIRNSKAELLVIAQKNMEENEFEELVTKYLKTTQESIKMFLELNTEVHTKANFRNIFELATRVDPHIEQEGNIISIEDEAPQDVQQDINNLLEKQKLFVTYIIEEDMEMATRLYNRFIDELGLLKLKNIKNHIIELFEILMEKLEHNFNISVKELITFSELETINNIDSQKEIKAWGKKAINLVVNKVTSNRKKYKLTTIERLKHYIMENNSNDISLEDAAEYVFLSPVYLSRLFKEQTGETFIDYIIKVKVDKAIELLKNPKYKVYEICSMVGYNDLKYFYKLFKKVKGCTPTEYRKKL